MPSRAGPCSQDASGPREEARPTPGDAQIEGEGRLGERGQRRGRWCAFPCPARGSPKGCQRALEPNHQTNAWRMRGAGGWSSREWLLRRPERRGRESRGGGAKRLWRQAPSGFWGSRCWRDAGGVQGGVRWRRLLRFGIERPGGGGGLATCAHVGMGFSPPGGARAGSAQQMRRAAIPRRSNGWLQRPGWEEKGGKGRALKVPRQR
jgi:hypothetical protein